MRFQNYLINENLKFSEIIVCADLYETTKEIIEIKKDKNTVSKVTVGPELFFSLC